MLQMINSSDAIHVNKLAKVIQLVVLFTGLAILSTGCAFTRTTVAINFKPVVDSPVGPKSVAYLSVGDIKDTRPVEDKYVLTHKFDGYGDQTSGAFVTEQPVAEVFKQGLIEALQTNGFARTASPTHFELRANIQQFDNRVISGFLEATVKPELTVRFELLDGSGTVVWRDTMIGRSTLQTPWGNGEFIVKTFNAAAEDAIRQLLADDSFRGYFLPKKT